MAKIQQYFTQRDEQDLQQTEKDTDEVDVPVPAIDEAPLNLSTPQTNVTSLLAEPRNTEEQKPLKDSKDVERNQVPATQTQKQEIDHFPVIHPELITSKSQNMQPALDSVHSHKSAVDSQLLENSQDKETLTSQAASLKCQMVDKSIGKTVEKAWECFEKSAMEKMGSTTNTKSGVRQTNQMDSPLLENNQESRSFGHHYTFETIVAPLYHQVFERMENDRRKVKNSTSKADEAAGKLDHGRLRVVTCPSVQARSNPKISAQHGNDDDPHGACKETFGEYVHNTKSANDNALSVPNAQTKLAFQHDAFPNIMDNLPDANISETEQAVMALGKQHSSDRRNSVFWEESTIDQTEQTPEMILLQSQCSDEYSLDNKPCDSGHSLHTLQEEQTCTDSATLATQSEIDITADKPSPAKASENPQSEDRSVTQISLETRIFNEIDEMQDQGAQTSERTLNTYIRCLDESYTCDISSNVTPISIQSHASSPSQDLTQVTDQTRIPATIFLTPSLEITGATVPHLQTTDDKNLIQETNQLCESGESSHHIGSEMESNPSERNDGVDICRIMGNDTETIQKEILQMSPEGAAVDGSQITDYKENQTSLLNSPDEVSELDELLVQDMAMSNIRSNPDNPEDAPREGVEEDVKENIRVKNPGKNEEQKLPEYQSEEVKEIKEVEKQLEEEEEQQQQQQQQDKQEVEIEEQESEEKVELANGKYKDGSYYTENDEEEVKKDNEQKDAEPRRNEAEWEDEMDLQAQTEEQDTVHRVTSVATLQSIPTIDSFIGEIHLDVGNKQQDTGLEQTSEEPVSERHTVGGEEEISCGTNPSRQALTINLDVALTDRDEEVENDSKFVDQEEDTCQQIDKHHVAEDVIVKVDTLLEEQERECLNEQSENIDDSTSTESLTDDEMELYLLRLRNTQQTGLKDAIPMGKRHSISRTRTIPSPMPSIAEYMDEDQPNALLDDLTPGHETEPERGDLPLFDEEEKVIDSNLLWWREFFSYTNMTKMIVYTFLFVVFLITAYVCDFIACFGLYLIALYWLYFQVQREPLKST